MSVPKRHHFVPQSYLERFTEEGVVSVRRRDGASFTAGTLNVAVESGFYDLTSPDGTRSRGVEMLLADVEGAAGAAFRSIDASGSPPAAGSTDRAFLAVYLALQFTRTPEHREQAMFPERVRDFLQGRNLTSELTREFLETRHLRFRPSEPEVQGAFEFCSVALADPEPMTTELSMAIMLQSVEQIAPLLDSMTWTIEHDRKGRLITSDSPLTIWRSPTPRDGYEGVGLATAEEIRFPLDPAKQLVLTRRRRSASARVPPERTRACNADVASGCHQFLVGPPTSQTRLGELNLRPHRPILRFNSGPGYTVGAGGKRECAGNMLHIWVSRR